MRQTQGHGLEAGLIDIGDQARHVLANTTENLAGSGAGTSGDGSQVVAGQLRKGVAENLVLNQDRCLLRLLLDLVKQLGQNRGDLAIDQLVELGDGLDGAVPLLEQVELDPIGEDMVVSNVIRDAVVWSSRSSNSEYNLLLVDLVQRRQTVGHIIALNELLVLHLEQAITGEREIKC